MLLPFCLSAAAAAGCAPQHLVQLPVRLVEGVPVLSLTINNQAAALILDTGAELTILSGTAADRLGLKRNSGYRRGVRGVDGRVVSGTIELPGLTAAGVRLPNFGALVGSIGLPALSDVSPDGLLGADILSSFEVDLDLAHNRLDLYNRPPCPLDAPPWGQAYAVVEANRSLHDRLFFQVEINGRTLAALFDTGAQRSLLDIRAALALGVGEQALRREPMTTLHGVSGSAGVRGYLHRFRQLVIGGQKIADPALVVAPLDLVDADLILGTDFLKDRRLWLSYGSHRIFLDRR